MAFVCQEIKALGLLTYLHTYIHEAVKTSTQPLLRVSEAVYGEKDLWEQMNFSLE